jgi:hypothetical protein
MEYDVLAIGHIDKGRVIVRGNLQTFAGGAVHFGGIGFVCSRASDWDSYPSRTQ